MDIDSYESLQRLEKHIKQLIHQFKLEEVLIGLQQGLDIVPDFILGGTALFAIRHCKPSQMGPNYRAIQWVALDRLTNLVAQFQLADPLGFDQNIQENYYNSNPVLTLLRIFGNQAPYSIVFFGQHARPLLLFQEIPKQIVESKRVAAFDLESSFQQISGVSLTDFINVGYVSFVAAHSNPGFTRGYFENARSQGFDLPKGNLILPALNKLAADPRKLKQLYLKYRSSDRRFGMYDFNPLFLHPIVRPWQQKNALLMNSDRLVAPIPNLILYRISMGIFYDLFNHFKTDFSNYFGHVFEAYVGRILNHSLCSGNLMSEDEVRKTYSSEKGKVPDWIIVDGTTAILVECKATRFSRAALTTGDENAINDSLKQVIKGLRQLHWFRESCIAKQPGLEALHSCNNFKPLLVSLEPLYLVNSTFFREYIDAQLASEGIVNLPWRILAIDQLEKLQPHLAVGMELSTVLEELERKQFDSILDEAHKRTGLTFKDSFLFSVSEELDKRLGIYDKIKLA